MVCWEGSGGAAVQFGDPLPDPLINEVSNFAKRFDFRTEFFRKSVRSRNSPLVGMGREGKNSRAIDFRFRTEEDRVMDDLPAEELLG